MIALLHITLLCTDTSYAMKLCNDGHRRQSISRVLLVASNEWPACMSGHSA